MDCTSKSRNGGGRQPTEGIYEAIRINLRQLTLGNSHITFWSTKIYHFDNFTR